MWSIYEFSLAWCGSVDSKYGLGVSLLRWRVQYVECIRNWNFYCSFGCCPGMWNLVLARQGPRIISGPKLCKDIQKPLPQRHITVKKYSVFEAVLALSLAFYRQSLTCFPFLFTDINFRFCLKSYPRGLQSVILLASRVGLLGYVKSWCSTPFSFVLELPIRKQSAFWPTRSLSQG